MKRKTRSLQLLSMTALLYGCSMGPKYEPPIVDIPCEWNSQISDGMDLESPDCFVWWESLNDPVLSNLICMASENNLDLSIAAVRILEAREEENGASSGLYPRFDVTAGYVNTGYNKKLVDRLLGKKCVHAKSPINFFEVGFDADWEIDLFGKSIHDLSAAQARTQATQEEFYSVWITLSAEVAKNYIQLRGQQKNLALIEKNIESQKDTLKLTHDLMQGGFLGTLDQHQVEEQLSILSAKRPQIQLSIDRSIHRLSVLLGYNPGDLYADLLEASNLPKLPFEKPLGIPSELLRRRPDIRKAERNLAAATEEVGSAIAGMFPRFSLRGFVGDIGALGLNSFTWFAGPTMLLPIFNSKALEKDVKLNEYKAQEALYVYQKTVLEALEESENAIAAFHYEMERNKHLADAEKTSSDVYEVALQHYQRGLKDYLEVLVIFRSYIASEEAYLDSQMEVLMNYVSLYKALGGGW